MQMYDYFIFLSFSYVLLKCQNDGCSHILRKYLVHNTVGKAVNALMTIFQNKNNIESHAIIFSVQSLAMGIIITKYNDVNFRDTYKIRRLFPYGTLPGMIY